jgi:N-acetyl-gamma-glutamyl-phosphate/LysW-gamma-L-alpha-aminoadipyl-6-phosphate reductase
MTRPLSVSIVGGSGYVGGELLRLLLFHPDVSIQQVTSASRAGLFVHSAHPNLRGVTQLKFVPPDQVDAVEVLFLAQAHGQAARTIDTWAATANRVVDCSADFRLRRAAEYERWYGEKHPAPDWLDRFVYGLPELRRDEIREATYVSGVGCNATVTTLAIAPLVRAGLVERVVADVKVGSSEGGSQASDSSHHPERSGAVRSFKPTGHRHQAEIRQELGDNFALSFSVTSVELVRGALVTAHCFLHNEVDGKALWKLYREAYQAEPFMRLVRQRTGVFRYPEPKLLAGTNYCDVGFEVDDDPSTNRVVAIAAIDNLMKGAAGTAVQCMNLMCGLDEAAGLTFPGLHPL